MLSYPCKLKLMGVLLSNIYQLLNNIYYNYKKTNLLYDSVVQYGFIYFYESSNNQVYDIHYPLSFINNKLSIKLMSHYKLIVIITVC